jgi:hypothetical protein
MKDRPKNVTRGAFVQSAVMLPALAGLLYGAATTTARAAKGSKTQFKYQTTPNGSKKCSNCTFFIPGKSATADGTCKVVDGSIGPNAYCIAWSAKTT